MTPASFLRCRRGTSAVRTGSPQAAVDQSLAALFPDRALVVEGSAIPAVMLLVLTIIVAYGTRPAHGVTAAGA